MATVPATIKGSPRGIQNTLSGFVVESENFDTRPVQEDFDDQNGARADERVYDTEETLDLTVYGASANADIANVVVAMPTGYTGKKIVYAGKTWKVDSCKEAGTYNGRRRWSITGHKRDNFPPQETAQGGNGGGSQQGGNGGESQGA